MTDNNIDYFDFVKTQNKNSIFSDTNIKQLINMIAGNAKIDKTKFADEKESKIAKIYMRMYFSLVMVRWCRGETLGVARQKSLEQMDNYVKSKENNHDQIGKSLTDIKEQMHPEFAKINMIDKDNADKNLEIDETQKKKLEQDFSKEFKESLEMLNQMSGQNTMEKTLGKSATENLNKQKAENFAAGKQKTQQLMQQLMLQQLMRQRAA